jgi:hypothetical protein
MNALDGCRLLVQRAREHSGELNASIRAFLSSQPYTFPIEFDHEKAEGILKFHVLREPDPTWSIHLGEIIHNLRSALDHLAFALAEIESGPAPNPAPAGGGWRNIQFPICDTRNDFSAKKRRYLRGVNASDQAIIERVNLTLRQHVAAVGRHVMTLCKDEVGLRQQLALYHVYYTFCLPHASLRLPLPQPEPTNASGSAKR